MKVTTREPLSDDRLARARVIARTLDAAIRIPGTGIRIGADAALGLIPGLGDIAGAVFSGYLVLLGVRLGLPSSVIARMIANIGIDTMVGAVPVLGDLFDIGWKSNLRNLDLLERATGNATPPQTGRWRLLPALAAIVLLLGVSIAMAIWLTRAVIDYF